MVHESAAQSAQEGIVREGTVKDVTAKDVTGAQDAMPKTPAERLPLRFTRRVTGYEAVTSHLICRYSMISFPA